MWSVPWRLWWKSVSRRSRPGREELNSDHRSKAERRAELLKLDPAEATLDLKVLDPAMGSGHFLVTAVDFLSDYIAELVEYVPAVPEWLDGGYVSPLVERVAAIRRDLLQARQRLGLGTLNESACLPTKPSSVAWC